MTTWIAVSTIYLRLYRHLLSHMKLCDIFSKFCNLTGNLMSLCYRIFCKRMFSMINMNI